MGTVRADLDRSILSTELTSKSLLPVSMSWIEICPFISVNGTINKRPMVKKKKEKMPPTMICSAFGSAEDSELFERTKAIVEMGVETGTTAT